MDFENLLQQVVDQVKEKADEDKTDKYYSFLLSKFSKINSISDLQTEYASIIHFLVDSYNGDKKLEHDLVEFIGLYVPKM